MINNTKKTQNKNNHINKNNGKTRWFHELEVEKNTNQFSPSIQFKDVTIRSPTGSQFFVTIFQRIPVWWLLLFLSNIKPYHHSS